MSQEQKIFTGFSLNSCSGGAISLDNIPAKYIVLYFYPKDDTPGCTIEAQEFSKLKQEFKDLDVEVFGISKDDIESHKKFTKKYDLSVELLQDHEGLSEQLGIWVEKNMYGKKYFGIERTTYLLDSEKSVIKIWNKVKAENHAEEVLEFIKQL
ncbi:MAG: peroxiredoxin [Rickettsiaceae bacterium]|nr:peroxiredoxin [Rickettsiaceae bacterium]